MEKINKYFILLVLFIIGCNPSIEQLIAKFDSKDISVKEKMSIEKQLAAKGDKATPKLLEIVRPENNNYNTYKFRYCLETLAEIGSKAAANGLVDMANTSNTGYRLSIIRTLADFNLPELYDTFVYFLKNDKHPSVRVFAAAGINQTSIRNGFCIDNAVDLLTEYMISDNSSGVRYYIATFVLSSCKRKKVIDAYILLLKNDKNDDVRDMAAVSLGKIGSEEAIMPLIESLKDSSKDVRSNSLKSLRKITDMDFGYDYNAWKKRHKIKLDKR